MSRTILIVEDEPNIVVPLQFTFEQKGYQVVVAATGEEALEMIEAHPPDLILLDIMLPGIDGYEVCQMVRDNADYNQIKIVFLSAMGRDMDVAKGRLLAADAYIIKPFSIFDVIEKVNDLLTSTDS
jgi:two-component system alkaline phosphatase synthesis response regulator PhoP